MNCTKLANSLFSDCLKLKDVPFFVSFTEKDGVSYTVPFQDKSVQSALIFYGAQVLSSETFQGCEKLTRIRLPDFLESIENSAFMGCSRLVDFDVSKVSLNVTGAIDWGGMFSGYADTGECFRIEKVICRREQADKMKSVFTKATLEFVD